jgi:hypothetical protein
MQSNSNAKERLLHCCSPIYSLAWSSYSLQPCFFSQCSAQAAVLPGLLWFASNVEPDL